MAADELFGLRGVKKSYRGRLVLDVAELVIQRGLITAVMGPNGAGKTALLHILALLQRPDAGDLRFLGQPVERAGELRRQITMVAQDPYLFHGGVERNVAHGLALRGVERTTRRRLAAQALELVGLDGFGQRRARGLSGGEQQRVALARALVLEPTALLLDEPFANLDAAGAALVEEIIAGLPAQGCSVVVVLHDAEQAARLAQRVVRLRHGVATSH